MSRQGFRWYLVEVEDHTRDVRIKTWSNDLERVRRHKLAYEKVLRGHELADTVHYETIWADSAAKAKAQAAETLPEVTT